MNPKAPHPMVLDTMALENAKILIVDDEIANIRLLEIMLEHAGFHDVWSTTDPRQTLPLYREVGPDLLLLDLQMPCLDGFGVMRAVAEAFPENAAPVLVLTADATRPTKHRALQEGANDFLCKPFDEVEVLLRIRNLLELRAHAVLLEQKVRERTQDLDRARLEVLERLAHAAEYRDTDTADHTNRVAVTAARIAERMGMCPGEVEDLYRATPLHDLGKIGIDDAVLLKPGRLTDEETVAMRRHVTIGSDILSGGASRLLQLAERIARFHHERWDGGGYLGVAGEAIPLAARIVSVADVFDALTHERPYKRAWSVPEAVEEIARGAGTQFDPGVVAAFLGVDHDALV